MAGVPVHDDSAASSRIDGHKLSEFVYGTITGFFSTKAVLWIRL